MTSMWTAEDPVISALLEAAMGALDVELILLFGSRASGTQKPDSDYDILIVARTDLPPPQRIDAVRMRLLHLQSPLDIIVVTPEEFAALKQWKSTVVSEAARTGAVLYEAA